MVEIDKECYFIMINGSIHQEGITIVNSYAPNIRTLKCIEQKLTEQERNKQQYNNR